MADVQFAKSFLSNLDRKPIKVSSDFVSDPKSYPSQSPYILPKPSHPFPKRTSNTSPTGPSSLTVTLRPTKPPHEPLTLSDQDPSLVTVLDLKTRYAEHIGGLDVPKIKILYNKRPTSDLKTLKELLPTGGAGDAVVELSVMVLGGAGAGDAVKTEVDSVGPGSEAAAAEKRAMGTEGSAGQALGTEVFWEDLKGFLVQRLRDEAEGKRLVNVFRTAAGR